MKKAFLTQFIIILSFVTASFAQQREKPVTLEPVQAKKISATEYDIIIKTNIEEGWHQYSLRVNPVCNDTTKKDITCPYPTEIKFNKSADYELVGKPTESKPIEVFDKVFEV